VGIQHRLSRWKFFDARLDCVMIRRTRNEMFPGSNREDPFAEEHSSVTSNNATAGTTMLNLLCEAESSSVIYLFFTSE
jgi:hypothetical protein